MSQIRRIWYACMMTVGIALAMVIYFRVGVDYLQPMVTGEFAGPFTDEAELAFFVVPVALSIILAATWFWVLVAPQQEETKRAQVRPPR